MARRIMASGACAVYNSDMNPVDKISFWVWPAGVAIFGIVPVIMLAVLGSFSGVFLMVMSILYAVGLGRAVLRRDLISRGISVDS
jgi:hypothetical protein